MRSSCRRGTRSTSALDLKSFAGLRAVLDGRGALDPAAVEALGITYVGIGR